MLVTRDCRPPATSSRPTFHSCDAVASVDCRSRVARRAGYRRRGTVFAVQPYQLIVKDPIPVWLVGEGHSPDISDSPVMDLMRTRDNPQFRGVPIDRLLNVIQTGVDVEPTNAPIWCGDLDKALEYARSADGRFGPGLVFALRRKMLERTYKTLPLDASAAEIAAIGDLYPNKLKLNNELWFSRLDPPHPRI